MSNRICQSRVVKERGPVSCPQAGIPSPEVGSFQKVLQLPLWE